MQVGFPWGGGGGGAGGHNTGKGAGALGDAACRQVGAGWDVPTAVTRNNMSTSWAGGADPGQVHLSCLRAARVTAALAAWPRSRGSSLRYRTLVLSRRLLGRVPHQHTSLVRRPLCLSLQAAAVPHTGGWRTKITRAGG